MSRNGDIVIEWAGKERLFRLAWGELEKLQELCDCGPFYQLSRMQTGMARLEDVLETIRWGLVGGGLTPADASKIVNVWVKDRPVAENLITAQLILAAALHGAPEEDKKKVGQKA